MEVAMKRRNKAEQRAIVEEWTASEQGMPEFCSERGISMQSLTRWVRAHGEHQNEDQGPGVFLPVSLLPKEEPKHEDPCRILIGKTLSLECTSRTHPKALETALSAAAELCGLI
jgi:hypothetical protein